VAVADTADELLEEIPRLEKRKAIITSSPNGFGGKEKHKRFFRAA